MSYVNQFLRNFYYENKADYLLIMFNNRVCKFDLDTLRNCIQIELKIVSPSRFIFSQNFGDRISQMFEHHSVLVLSDPREYDYESTLGDAWHEVEKAPLNISFMDLYEIAKDQRYIGGVHYTEKAIKTQLMAISAFLGNISK